MAEQKPQFIFKDFGLALNEAQHQKSLGNVKVGVRKDEIRNEYGVFVYPA